MRSLLSSSNAKNSSTMMDGVFQYSNGSGAPTIITLNITAPAQPAGSTPDFLPPTDKSASTDDTSHILAYVLVPLGSLVLIAVLSFLVVFILKKSKLDKLRHHLMPLYNFDPAEEEGDWESELLEEDREQQVALQIRSPSLSEGPKLKFTTESLEV